MTKKDIAAVLSNEYSLSKKDAETVVLLVLDTAISGAMEDGRTQCGKHIFTKKTRACRTGRNPKTGESIAIPERTMVVYKQGIRQ